MVERQLVKRPLLAGRVEASGAPAPNPSDICVRRRRAVGGLLPSRALNRAKKSPGKSQTHDRSTGDRLPIPAAIAIVASASPLPLREIARLSSSIKCNTLNNNATHRSHIIAKHLYIFDKPFGDKIHQIRRSEIIVPPVFRTISFVSVRQKCPSLDTEPRGEGSKISLESLEAQKHIQSLRNSVYS